MNKTYTGTIVISRQKNNPRIIFAIHPDMSRFKRETVFYEDNDHYINATMEINRQHGTIMFTGERLQQTRIRTLIASEDRIELDSFSVYGVKKEAMEKLFREYNCVNEQGLREKKSILLKELPTFKDLIFFRKPTVGYEVLHTWGDNDLLIKPDSPIIDHLEFSQPYEIVLL